MPRRIGSGQKVGNVGQAGKRRGPLGNPTTAYGSSLHTDLERAKSFYPTTTTAPVTTTTAPVTTTTAPITTTTSV